MPYIEAKMSFKLEDTQKDDLQKSWKMLFLLLFQSQRVIS